MAHLFRRFLEAFQHRLAALAHKDGPDHEQDTLPRQRTASLPETLPLTPQKGAAAPLPEETPRPLQLEVGLGLSPGRQRHHNEDTLLAQTINLAAGEQDLLVGLYIVADGMGGHQHGELASAAAARAFAHRLYHHLFRTLLAPEPQMPETPLIELLHDAMAEANRTVLESVPGGGTTLTAALILGQHLIIAHVGDSRAYYFHPDGRWEVLTRDHSLVKRLEELGQLTPEEAAVHPQRNVLYRALGQAEPLEPEVTQRPLPTDGALLLCSDGLWGVVPEEEIRQIVFQAPTAAQACAQLTHQANEYGGPDNISVILVRFGKT